MNTFQIRQIEIYSRGKNRDVFGNPYHAFKAIISAQKCSYFRQIMVIMPMTWGDSGERDCLEWAVQGINEAFGTEIKANDPRIIHHHKHVSHDEDLLHPENWKTI